MFTKFLSTRPRLMMRLSQAAILLSLGAVSQAQLQAATFPPGVYSFNISDTFCAGTSPSGTYSTLPTVVDSVQTPSFTSYSTMTPYQFQQNLLPLFKKGSKSGVTGSGVLTGGNLMGINTAVGTAVTGTTGTTGSFTTTAIPTTAQVGGDVAGFVKVTLAATYSVSPTVFPNLSTNPLVLTAGTGGMTLAPTSANTVATLMPLVSLLEISSSGGSTALNPVNINVVAPVATAAAGLIPATITTAATGILTGLQNVSSTQLLSGGVIRIKTATAASAAALAALTSGPGAVPGLEVAFGIPTPVWGGANGISPWLIIDTATTAAKAAPAYAYRGAAGVTTASALGWADEIGSAIDSAIVMDLNSLQMLLAATTAAMAVNPTSVGGSVTTGGAPVQTPFTTAGTAYTPAVVTPSAPAVPSISSYLGIVSARGPNGDTSTSATWNIGVIGGGSISGANINTLLSAAGLGVSQLVVAGGSTIS